jgi:uncharacterized protein
MEIFDGSNQSGGHGAGPTPLEWPANDRAGLSQSFASVARKYQAGKETRVTAGYLRAGLRKVDEAASEPGAPVLPCRKFEAVPIGEIARYRIPLVPNARRFKEGHRLRLYLTTDDQGDEKPALLMFRHASIGTNSLNTIHSSSRLLLPVLPRN